MFALDTNTLVYFFKGVGRVRDRLLAVAPSEVGIPSVVLFELGVGINLSVQSAKRRSQLDVLLAAVSILPLDDAAARQSAELATGLRRTGSSIGPMDTLI